MMIEIDVPVASFGHLGAQGVKAKVGEDCEAG
jgi:hypothetical protein